MTKQRGRLLVFMDGECAVCRVTSSVLDATDRGGSAEVVNYREDTRYRDHGITEDAASTRIQVIDTTTGRIYEGFEATRAIAREVQLLWPLRPVLWHSRSEALSSPLHRHGEGWG